MRYLSIVIPAYNEEEILRTNLSKIVKYLNGHKLDWEMIVVDDGSRDKTPEIVKSSGDKRVILLSLGRNMGKGKALKEGVLRTNGKFVIFMDADLSVPLRFIKPMLDLLEGSPVVIGSRRTEKSRILKHQPFVREAMGRVYTFIARLVSGVKLKDFTCGFKGFSQKAAKMIFGKSVINRWSYDTEIIFLAHKFGFKIDQLPVEWLNREDSRVRLGKDTITSFVDLLRIRINNFRGVYD
jgi:dolichyl-phosphate beta-glucosyltransferase